VEEDEYVVRTSVECGRYAVQPGVEGGPPVPRPGLGGAFVQAHIPEAGGPPQWSDRSAATVGPAPRGAAGAEDIGDLVAPPRVVARLYDDAGSRGELSQDGVEGIAIGPQRRWQLQQHRAERVAERLGPGPEPRDRFGRVPQPPHVGQVA